MHRLTRIVLSGLAVVVLLGIIQTLILTQTKPTAVAQEKLPMTSDRFQKGLQLVHQVNRATLNAIAPI